MNSKDIAVLRKMLGHIESMRMEAMVFNLIVRPIKTRYLTCTEKYPKRT